MREPQGSLIRNLTRGSLAHLTEQHCSISIQLPAAPPKINFNVNEELDLGMDLKNISNLSSAQFKAKYCPPSNNNSFIATPELDEKKQNSPIIQKVYDRASDCASVYERWKLETRLDKDIINQTSGRSGILDRLEEQQIVPTENDDEKSEIMEDALMRYFLQQEMRAAGFTDRDIGNIQWAKRREQRTLTGNLGLQEALQHGLNGNPSDTYASAEITSAPLCLHSGQTRDVKESCSLENIEDISANESNYDSEFIYAPPTSFQSESSVIQREKSGWRFDASRPISKNANELCNSLYTPMTAATSSNNTSVVKCSPFINGLLANDGFHSKSSAVHLPNTTFSFSSLHSNASLTKTIDLENIATKYETHSTNIVSTPDPLSPYDSENSREPSIDFTAEEMEAFQVIQLVAAGVNPKTGLLMDKHIIPSQLESNDPWGAQKFYLGSDLSTDINDESLDTLSATQVPLKIEKPQKKQHWFNHMFDRVTGKKDKIDIQPFTVQLNSTANIHPSTVQLTCCTEAL